MSMGQPIRPLTRNTSKSQTANELITKAQEQLRRSIEENTEFNNIFVANSIKNIRAGLPDHEIIRRAQDRMAIEVAKAEAVGSKEVVFRFPLVIGKKLLYALTFLLSVLTLPARFLAQIFGILRAKISPPPPGPGFRVQNWGRTSSMIEEGRFGSRANQVADGL
jgi:hypothetical protein